jgi:hypothetical protein
VITWSVQHAGETLWTLLSDKISLQVWLYSSLAFIVETLVHIPS